MAADGRHAGGLEARRPQRSRTVSDEASDHAFNLSSWTLRHRALVTFLLVLLTLFGVLSYTVSQRKREFALRSALGATPADLVRLILKNALTMTLCGLAAGTFLSFVLVKYLDTLLYGIKAHDWLSFAAVDIIIIIMSLLSCMGPAIRTLRIDPIRSLGGH